MHFFGDDVIEMWFADLSVAGVGIPLVPRLGDPCEDPGVIESMGWARLVRRSSCRVVSSGGGRR